MRVVEGADPYQIAQIPFNLQSTRHMAGAFFDNGMQILAFLFFI